MPQKRNTPWRRLLRQTLPLVQVVPRCDARSRTGNPCGGLPGVAEWPSSPLTKCLSFRVRQHRIAPGLLDARRNCIYGPWDFCCSKGASIDFVNGLLDAARGVAGLCCCRPGTHSPSSTRTREHSLEQRCLVALKQDVLVGTRGRCERDADDRSRLNRGWRLCQQRSRRRMTRIIAVGSVTNAGHIALNYVSPDARFRGVSRNIGA